MTKLIPFLVLAATACTSALDPATLIARDRVLGAKVTVDTDPTRAWPAPGEHATITWLTASPGETPDFSWTLAACPAATTTGLPICDGPVFAHAASSGPVPTLALAIPSDMEARSIVVLGAICASGSPVIDPATFEASCDDGSHADLVSQHVFLARGGETNHHPDLAGAPFVLDGAAWEASDVPCDGLPEIAAGTENIVLGAELDAAARETFTFEGALWREELQLSPFATAGEINQRYAYVEADDDRPVSRVAVEWTAPGADEIPADGLRVTFNFVIRDMRGGVDAATRALCVR
jgi:hypothetical protein